MAMDVPGAFTSTVWALYGKKESIRKHWPTCRYQSVSRFDHFLVAYKQGVMEKLRNQVFFPAAPTFVDPPSSRSL